MPESMLLEDACRQVALVDPTLQRRIRESPTQSAQAIEAELTGFLEAVHNDRKALEQSGVPSLQPWLTVYDLALLQLCDLALFTRRAADKRAVVFWPEPGPHRNRPRPEDVLSILCSTLAQTAQAVRSLVLTGYEGPARVMARYLVEMADLVLAVTAYQDIYLHYIRSYPDPKDTYRHWKRYYSPAVIRQRLERLDWELALSARTRVPAAEVREDTYTWLSATSHANLVGQLVMAHTSPMGEDSFAPVVMLGAIGDTSKHTLQRLLLYFWLFFLELDGLLVQRHLWSRLRGSNNRQWFFYRSRVYCEVFEHNYALLQGIGS